MNKLSIQYPRGTAKIELIKPTRKQVRLEKDIDEIENSEIYIKLLSLRAQERELNESRLKFTCENAAR